MSPLTTPQEQLAAAVTDAIKASHETVRAAILAAHEAGVSVNEIARRASLEATGVAGYSRHVVRETLGAESLYSRALKALRAGGYTVGTVYSSGLGQELELRVGPRREVQLHLLPGQDEKGVAARYNFCTGVDQTLRAAGMGLCQGESTLDMWQRLGDGETVEIYER
ncbi:hypothetical protein GCM10017673_38110 [Streptosporangium violaceochromogenes]|nr:hypothetical protein GCM10017673_38110 [Streptosporangium violaceochromogenes]